MPKAGVKGPSDMLEDSSGGPPPEPFISQTHCRTSSKKSEFNEKTRILRLVLPKYRRLGGIGTKVQVRAHETGWFRPLHLVPVSIHTLVLIHMRVLPSNSTCKIPLSTDFLSVGSESVRTHFDSRAKPLDEIRSEPLDITGQTPRWSQAVPYTKSSEPLDGFKRGFSTPR